MTGPSPDVSSAPRNAVDTRARILLAAQDIFSHAGYSHAGLREIARQAKVAPSLLIKYFGSKARLFEEALVSAILPLETFQKDRARLGEVITASIITTEATMRAPAMIALSLGDPESRAISARVVNQQIIEPMAAWLGLGSIAPLNTAQALTIFAMTTGFAMIQRNLGTQFPGDVQREAVALFAQSLQALVEPG